MLKLLENLSTKLKMSGIMSSFIVLFLLIGAVVFYSIYRLGEALDMANTQNLPALVALRTIEVDNDRMNLLINYAVSEIANPKKVKELLVEINKNKEDFQQQFRVLDGIGIGKDHAILDKIALDVRELVFEVEQVNDFLSFGQKTEAEAAVDYLNDTTVKLKKSIEVYKNLVMEHLKQLSQESVKLRDWVSVVVILIMSTGLGLGLLGLFILIRQRDLEIKKQYEELLHVTRVGKSAELVSSLAYPPTPNY